VGVCGTFVRTYQSRPCLLVFLFLGYRGSADKRMPWACRPAGRTVDAAVVSRPRFRTNSFPCTPFFLCVSLSSFFCLILVRLSLLQSWFGLVWFVCLVVFFSFFKIVFTCGLLFCVSIFEVVEAFLLLLLLISGSSSGSSRYVRCDFAQEEGRKLCMLEYYACRGGGGRREEKFSAVRLTYGGWLVRQRIWS